MKRPMEQMKKEYDERFKEQNKWLRKLDEATEGIQSANRTKEFNDLGVLIHKQETARKEIRSIQKEMIALKDEMHWSD